jgi:uncharacterized membrane protein YkoI
MGPTARAAFPNRRYAGKSTGGTLTAARRSTSASRQLVAVTVSTMNSRYFAMVLMLLGALTLGASAGIAGDKKDRKQHEHKVVREALQRGEVLPLVKILAIANKEVPGDVIEVELEDEAKALVYEIKILTSTGRVREVKIDARTGAVLSIEDD